MKNLVSTKVATSWTALLFTIIAISGVMMFFHFYDDYVKELHEILSLVFVGAVVLHILVHFKGLKNYFKLPLFIVSGLIVLAVSGGFVYEAASESGSNPKHAIIDAMLKSPIEQTVPLLNVNYNDAIRNLYKVGIDVQNGDSLDSLAKANKTSPFALVNVIKGVEGDED